MLILAAAPSVLGSARPVRASAARRNRVSTLVLQAIRLLAPPASRRRIDFIDLAVVMFVTRGGALADIADRIFLAAGDPEHRGLCDAFFHLLLRTGAAFACPGAGGAAGRGRLGRGDFRLLPEPAFGREPSRIALVPFGRMSNCKSTTRPAGSAPMAVPDHYASLLVMATGATLALACFSKWPWSLRIALFYIVAVLMAGLLFSARAAVGLLIGSVTALTFFGLRYGAVRWWVPVAGAVVFLVMLGAVLSQSSFAQDRLGEGCATCSARGACRVMCASSWTATRSGSRGTICFSARVRGRLHLFIRATRTARSPTRRC